GEPVVADGVGEFAVEAVGEGAGAVEGEEEVHGATVHWSAHTRPWLACLPSQCVRSVGVMNERLQISAHSPEGYRKVNTLDAYVTGNLDAELVNFIYLRASLINGCTYCVDAHSVDLAEGGTDPRRIYSVRTWRESSFYSERERAAFALTEAITL